MDLLNETVLLKTKSMHTKMHFSAKCNSGRIAIQWFYIKHYLDYQYTKFQPYTFRVQKMCVFARYATLVPRLYVKPSKVQALLSIWMDCVINELCYKVTILQRVSREITIYGHFVKFHARINREPQPRATTWPCYIQICVITRCVIKRLHCTRWQIV